VQSALLLNVVIGQRPAILQLLTCKNQTLLVRRNALLVLDLGFHVVDGVGRLNVERDGFTRQRLDKDLHATTQAQHQVQSALLLNVVIGQRPAILQLLTCKNQTLLVRRNALLVLDLGFHVVDGVGRLNVERNGFTRQRLHKDLHATTQAQHQVQGALLLNVVIGQRPAILELLACKNKTLLVRGNALLVLDLRFHVVDGV